MLRSWPAPKYWLGAMLDRCLEMKAAQVKCAGSRLWPLSTASKPKQFHALHGSQTMFAATLARVAAGGELKFASPIVVCGADHEEPVLSELAGANIADGTVVLEPMPRNTAPALAAAALVAIASDPDALLLVLPADHVITRPEQLHQACMDAREIALAGRIVTFAIKPLGPETGYGYIKSGQSLAPNVFELGSFREKPDLATAQAYLAEGGYAWNAGIFYFKASALIGELELYEPVLIEHVRAAFDKRSTRGNLIDLDSDAFGKAPSISIDYAVMERTRKAAVVPVDMGWSDVGSFATLWELSEKDEIGNSSTGDVALFDSANCYVNAHGTRVALIGVSDLVVIATPHGILVTKQDRSQDVRLAAQAFKD
jgi:mannose-1-phosphate guanylyltransferase / mannose-6-phosphate isomerase